MLPILFVLNIYLLTHLSASGLSCGTQISAVECRILQDAGSLVVACGMGSSSLIRDQARALGTESLES